MTTLDCVRPTQSSVIRVIYHNVGLKCFSFSFTKMFVCYNLYICIFYIYILQGSVEMHL